VLTDSLTSIVGEYAGDFHRSAPSGPGELGRPPGPTLSCSRDELQGAGLLGSIVEHAGEALAPRAQRRSQSPYSTIAFTAAHFEPGALPCVSPHKNSSAMQSLVCWRDLQVRPLTESSVPFG
jgi:hypothetical protein